MLTSIFFACLLVAWIILSNVRLYLTHPLIITRDAFLNGFLNVIMRWFHFKPISLSHLAKNSQRHEIMQNALSVYDVYSNLFRYLLYLEWFNIYIGIKVTSGLFKTILDILNKLTVLIARALSSNNKIRNFCFSSLCYNELLSPCFLK